ncbi:DUF2321 domain-containing protein [Rhodoblastus acidophilus]|uniref:DUF2321 domain-containing protein n=1 Tax=Candidatus Rhodoblastus alkanivorans TaxID=2954117 RepID=A0ABS9Z8H1_9HYPH|nr:DUF2321 domain-containing protein [Candidatus Rhodoblastus alkanivorans]MCI4678958.1 DUF2321 domain-containing protein [Candidatus Rhodoblastus alkanivorans]MCI4683736.1 DUF2321 domain-containing protein [Candidatus Rhodoblastus alkanivorans]MDI4641054.1 DUF2321 domain-containing protein [Rhodoblastus acidophilus]
MIFDATRQIPASIAMCYPRHMLSDACFEFLASLKEAAQTLSRNAAHYTDSPLGYGDEIDALLAACEDVQLAPWNEEAAIRLIKLASSVLAYYDTIPGSPEIAARQERMKTLVALFRSDLGDAVADEVATLIPDLTSESKKAESAALQLKPLLAKLGKVAYDMAIKIISDVASATVTKMLGL